MTSASRLATDLVDAYLENHRIARVLARRYGFRSLFFWQPSLAVDGKPLTEDERAMRSSVDASLQLLAREAYGRVARAASEREDLWYIADIFDDVDEQLWIDELGHVTPVGNALVARRILAEVGSFDTGRHEVPEP